MIPFSNIRYNLFFTIFFYNNILNIKSWLFFLVPTSVVSNIALSGTLAVISNFIFLSKLVLYLISRIFLLLFLFIKVQPKNTTKKVKIISNHFFFISFLYSESLLSFFNSFSSKYLIIHSLPLNIFSYLSPILFFKFFKIS